MNLIGVWLMTAIYNGMFLVVCSPLLVVSLLVIFLPLLLFFSAFDVFGGRTDGQVIFHDAGVVTLYVGFLVYVLACGWLAHQAAGRHVFDGEPFFGADDWAQAEPFRLAGFITMTPLLRAENGQPGAYSMFYNEVDDVLVFFSNTDESWPLTSGHREGKVGPSCREA